MATLAEKIAALEAELVTVVAAIAEATKAASIGTGSRTVGYQSLESLWKSRDRIEKKLAALEGTQPRVAAFDMRGNFDDG